MLVSIEIGEKKVFFFTSHKIMICIPYYFTNREAFVTFDKNFKS